MILLLTAGTLHAVANSYVPAAGGSWGTAGNWSLGHVPTSSEDVEVIADGGVDKVGG